MEPACQVLLDRHLGEVAVAVGLLDLPGVKPVGPLPGCVLFEHPRVGDAQLRGHIRGDRPRHVGRIGQKRAQEPDGAQLDSEPETVALSATNIDELAGGSVEMEISVQLRLVGVVHVAAVPALLLRGEEPLTQPQRQRPLPLHCPSLLNS